MKVSFTLTKRGKQVTCRNTSRGVPEGSKYLWDFGVLNGTSDEKDPPPIDYEEEGFYVISLTVIPPDPDKPITVENPVGISNSGLPTLSDTIYNLIDHYIPDDLLEYITYQDKRIYIEKWQLYIQPLVNHEIPIEEYSNEFAYSALENQLVMELAAYDWLMTGVMNLMRSMSSTVQDSSSSTTTEPSTDGNGRVKKIVTGPSEVEFFDDSISGEDSASITKSINSALQPGGLLDNIKDNLCMLAERLTIYLPICRKQSMHVVPKVVNPRNPGLLGGPNPKFPIKK